MALTESSMVALGTPLPGFRLPDTDGTYYSSDDFADRPLLVMFICNHCPYVKHIANELSRLSRDLAEARFAMVAIQSNDVEGYPEDHPELMRAEKKTATIGSHIYTTNLNKSRKNFKQLAHPISFFLTVTNGSPTAVASMRRGLSESLRAFMIPSGKSLTAET